MRSVICSSTAARHQLKERTEKLNEFIAAELLGKAEVIGATKLIIDMQKGSSMNELKNLGDMLIRDENVLAMLFGENGDSLVYQLARGRYIRCFSVLLCLQHAPAITSEAFYAALGIRCAFHIAAYFPANFNKEL